MKTAVDERFLEEARAFALRFGCEDCAYFEPEHELCGNGYPTAAHAKVDLPARRYLEFCKEFEFAGPAPRDNA
jgi:hypothetical protein